MTDETKSEGKNGSIIGPNQVIESSRRLDTVLTRSITDLRRGSLSTKVTSLAAEMDDFNRETHNVLDKVREKIDAARRKRDEAVEVHHAHYDGLINDFQDSIDAVERLSNIPLDSGGEQ